MTTALLQQALDALNESVDLVHADYAIAFENYGKLPTRQAQLKGLQLLVEKHEAAILALQAATAQPAQPAQQPICPDCNGSGEGTAMSYGRGPDDYEYAIQCPKCNGYGVEDAAHNIKEKD